MRFHDSASVAIVLWCSLGACLYSCGSSDEELHHDPAKGNSGGRGGSGHGGSGGAHAGGAGSKGGSAGDDASGAGGASGDATGGSGGAPEAAIPGATLGPAHRARTVMPAPERP